jgi:hypothetical protein
VTVWFALVRLPLSLWLGACASPHAFLWFIVLSQVCIKCAAYYQWRAAARISEGLKRFQEPCGWCVFLLANEVCHTVHRNI